MIDVNEYFEGKVKSLSVNNGELPATVGVMAPGEYTFKTGAKEAMTVVSGNMEVRLPGSADWQNFTAGDTFDVAGDSSFDLKIAADVAYLCVYG